MNSRRVSSQKTRHEVKAERIRAAKGRLKRPTVANHLEQFALRPLAPAGQLAPKELGRLLAQLEYFGREGSR